MELIKIEGNKVEYDRAAIMREGWAFKKRDGIDDGIKIAWQIARHQKQQKEKYLNERARLIDVMLDAEYITDELERQLIEYNIILEEEVIRAEDIAFMRLAEYKEHLENGDIQRAGLKPLCIDEFYYDEFPDMTIFDWVEEEHKKDKMEMESIKGIKELDTDVLELIAENYKNNTNLYYAKVKIELNKRKKVA